MHMLLSPPRIGNRPNSAAALACLRCTIDSGSSPPSGPVRLAQLALLARDLIQHSIHDWRLAVQVQAQASLLWSQRAPPGSAGGITAVEQGRQLACLLALGSLEPRLMGHKAHRELSRQLKRHVEQCRQVAGEQRRQPAADPPDLYPSPSDQVSHAAAETPDLDCGLLTTLSPVEHEVVATLKELGAHHDAVLEVQGKTGPLRRQEEQLRRKRRHWVRADIICVYINI